MPTFTTVPCRSCRYCIAVFGRPSHAFAPWHLIVINPDLRSDATRPNTRATNMNLARSSHSQQGHNLPHMCLERLFSCAESLCSRGQAFEVRPMWEGAP